MKRQAGLMRNHCNHSELQRLGQKLGSPSEEQKGGADTRDIPGSTGFKEEEKEAIEQVLTLSDTENYGRFFNHETPCTVELFTSLASLQPLSRS